MNCKWLLKFCIKNSVNGTIVAAPVTILIGSLAETFNGHWSLKPDIILPV